MADAKHTEGKHVDIDAQQRIKKVKYVDIGGQGLRPAESNTATPPQNTYVYTCWTALKRCKSIALLNLAGTSE